MIDYKSKEFKAAAREAVKWCFPREFNWVSRMALRNEQEQMEKRMRREADPLFDYCNETGIPIELLMPADRKKLMGSYGFQRYLLAHAVNDFKRELRQCLSGFLRRWLS
jgi:hypothetical protein